MCNSAQISLERGLLTVISRISQFQLLMQLGSPLQRRRVEYIFLFYLAINSHGKDGSLAWQELIAAQGMLASPFLGSQSQFHLTLGLK